MTKSPATIFYRIWGEFAGCTVYLFKITNATGAYADFINYGATLVSVVVPDRNGNLSNVVLGYPSLAGYLADKCYIGATIGRFANRIKGAKFTLEGITYQLQANDGNNANHGGISGFNTRIFSFEIQEDRLLFIYKSKDGEGGFPGNLKLTITYRFTDENELYIDFKAQTDEKTVANFTNHAYFNLSAQGDGVLGHGLTVYSNFMLEADANYIPSGLIKPVGRHALDGEPIGNKMKPDEQLHVCLNDCYLLDWEAEALKPAAKLVDNKSGRKLEVFTTYPSVIVYTGDFLNSQHHGNFSRPYEAFDGLCLECQYYPDSPNHAHFPSTVLIPGEEYHQIIVYKFGTEG